MENTTSPKPNIDVAVAPDGRLFRPSENKSPPIRRYTPLIIAVVIIYGKKVFLFLRTLCRASFK
jgi:hypothetical protein